MSVARRRTIVILCGLLSRLAIASNPLPDDLESGRVPSSHIEAGAQLCRQPFPYSATEFVRRLIEVADANDPRMVPEVFERVYATNLPHKKFPAGDHHAYRGWFARDCGWYTQVRVLNYRDTYLLLNDLTPPIPPLRFTHTGSLECLAPDTLTKLLSADGWHGGLTNSADVESAVYHKSPAEIWADVGSEPNRTGWELCVTSIHIRYAAAK
jgi:hypothetical protein